MPTASSIATLCPPSGSGTHRSRGALDTVAAWPSASPHEWRQGMATIAAQEQIGPQRLSAASWRALVASFLGWLFDGYETYALILVAPLALRQLLPPDQ